MALTALILAGTRGGAENLYDYVAAIEKDTECQFELCTLPHPPRSLFADINTFLAPGINEKCNSIEQSEAGDALARLEALIVHSPDNVRLYAPCLITGKDCYYECADTHISGSPCTDMSSYGLGKRETGKAT